MSQVKFEERETIRTTQQQQGGNGGGRGPPQQRGASLPQQRGAPPPQQKEDLKHKIGDALTAGAGPGGYLAVSTFDDESATS